MNYNINIAGNLKRLRKQKELSQEELANFIGVSFQAVSKWERGEGYPDITLLPIIANYFEVSVDELLGMNEIKDEQKLTKIFEEYSILNSQGKVKDSINLIQDAIKCFPNNYQLQAELAYSLSILQCESIEERKKNLQEAIKISERILLYCTDSKLRSDTNSNLCFYYFWNNEKQKAIELAKSLPSIYKTRENTIIKFLEGEELVNEAQYTIQRLCWTFYFQINQLTSNDYYTDDHKIILIEKAKKMYELVYEDQDYLFSNIRLAEINVKLARFEIIKCNYEDSIKLLKEAFNKISEFEELPDEKKHTSLLVNKCLYKKVNTSSSSERNMYNSLLQQINDIEEFKALHTIDSYIKLIEEIKAKCN